MSEHAERAGVSPALGTRKWPRASIWSKLARMVSAAPQRPEWQKPAEQSLADRAPALCHAELPHDADWAWRPGPWCRPLESAGLRNPASGTALGLDLTLFHDMPEADLTLKQVRNLGPDERTAFGLHLTIGDFAGCYVSLALDLPEQATTGLTAHHLVCADLQLQSTRPCDIYARLNLQCGPNTAHLIRALPPGGGLQTVAFDLAYAKFNEKRLDKMWLDLIVDDPERAHLTFSDLLLYRRPRAEF